MKDGAFALIDCLGFKGIWNTKDSDPDSKNKREEDLVAKFERIEEQIVTTVDQFNRLHRDSYNGPIRAQIRSISDTVAVSIQYEADNPAIDEINKGYLVWAASLSVAKIQALFLIREPLLTMRGCVSYGQHRVINNVLIGPAVDQAADNYEVAQGAFVWLLPSADARYQAGAALLAQGLLLPHEMPLKGGARLKCLIVNPLYFENSADQRRRMIESYDKAMTGDRLDVLLKRQNTLEFLQMADSSAAELEKKQ